MKIDFELLKKQKLQLVVLADTNSSLSKYQKEILDGIIHLLDALQDEQEDGKKEYYFLFGETASRLYHENDFESYLNKVKEESLEFDVHKFIEGEHPENIMEAASGWMDYASITKEEYEKLLIVKEEEL